MSGGGLGCIPHPIPYQGSKRVLAKEILRYFPSGIGKVIEPFAGSAAITLAAAYRRKAERFVINDINGPLMQLWDRIVNDPVGLSDAYERLWRDQIGRESAFYQEIRKEFNASRQPHHFLYLLARCVKASVRYNSVGEFNQSPDNRRKGMRPTTMRLNIMGASRLLRERTEIACRHYTEILGLASELDLIYMDPPYQGVCAKRDSRYIAPVSFHEFADALESLVEGGLSFIISYDGRTGDRNFGRVLPPSLGLTHIEIHAGPSSQATLLGRSEVTVESLYLSPALVNRLRASHPGSVGSSVTSMTLLEVAG